MLRLLFVFFLITPLFAINIKNVEFENQFSGCTGEVKAYPFGYYQVLRLYLEGSTRSKISFDGIIATRYKPLNKFYDFETFVWFVSLKYAYMNNAEVAIGNQRLNFSPYILHSEEWQDNFFRAIYFNYKSDIINFNSFIGCHTEWTNSVSFKNKTVKMNAGFLSWQYIDGVKSEEPSIWGGFKFDFKNLISLIYLHENYMYDRSGYGYYFFNNEIFGILANLSLIHFLKFNLFYSLMLKKYDAYNGFWDYYGAGKHRLFLDYTEYSTPSAYEITVNLNQPYNDATIFKFSLRYTYRYIDKSYNPFHIDNGLFDENRGEDDLENLYPDTKGYIVNILKPIFENFAIGYEQRKFKDYSEQRFIMKIFIMDAVYRIQKQTETDKLAGFYITGQITLKKNLKLFLKYSENRYFIKGQDELILKVSYVF